MTAKTADVVICGAGIAGISTAYQLTVHHGVKNVVLVDRLPPMSLTSDKSTECYRNWWPGPGNSMVRMTNRSIDILEDLARQTGNLFNLNRRGYLFATANAERIIDFQQQAEEAESFGAGPLRIHSGSSDDPIYQPAPMDGFEDQPTGADLITNSDLIHEHFPYLTEETVAVVHPRRCGWFSAQQLGAYFLQQAKMHGAQLIEGEIQSICLNHDRVQIINVGTKKGDLQISTSHFVNAAGPHIRSVASLMNVELPVYHEFHAKISFDDSRSAFPRQAPLVIWTDPVRLPWREEEKDEIAGDNETRFLLDEFPQGVHGRPEGAADSPIVLILWTYDLDPVEPRFPPEYDPYYPEIVLRGMGVVIPQLQNYFDRPPKPYMDGGYYTKTQENRPLVGPMGIEGAWMLGALSGYGLMASPACGELLAKHITGDTLPDYANWFLLSRYQEPQYKELLKDWGRSGQL